MRLLLDTHAFLWALTAPERLSKRARKSIEDEDNEVNVSAATVWEIAIKASLGRLEPGLAELELSLPREIERHAFRPLPVHVRHALSVAALPPLHRDPFDRLLQPLEHVDQGRRTRFRPARRAPGQHRVQGRA